MHFIIRIAYLSNMNCIIIVMVNKKRKLHNFAAVVLVHYNNTINIF